MGSVNWVKARSECSLARIFQTLAEVVDSDVQVANGLGRTGVRFHFSTEASGKIIVTRDRDLGGVNEIRLVVFELAGQRITVTAKTSTGEGKKLLSAAANFNDEGECLLAIDGQQSSMKLWQVSRHSLEDLFFNF